MASEKLNIGEPGRDQAESFVRRHFADLVEDAPSTECTSSDAFRGGQSHADKALSELDLNGYTRNRTQAYPQRRRAGSRLSPYIRHGLIDLPQLWEAVDGPEAEVDRFRLELLWQEYARHLYARLGSALRQPLRYQWQQQSPDSGLDRSTDPDWNQSMGCVEITTGELEDDGWLVGQSRLWLASQWSVREGKDWRAGEDYFFRHLLDGSRAANRLGWQTAAGLSTGRPYNFSRWQVESRALGLCASCELNTSCPIDRWPDRPRLTPVAEEHPLLGTDPDGERTAGPTELETRATGAEPDVVWMTAESMSDRDPATMANPDLPIVFVFDRPLLAKLRLSSKRLVFMVEALAELAGKREVEVHLGSPIEVLSNRNVATTFAPVPGFRRAAAVIKPVHKHPWRWLRRPGLGDISSFTAWTDQLVPANGKHSSDQPALTAIPVPDKLEVI